MTDIDEADAYTQLEYFQRLQPARERPGEAGAALVTSLAVVVGLASFYFAPLKLGPIAIFLSMIAMAVSGTRNSGARVAFIIAVAGFTIGMLLAVLTDSSPLK